MKIPRPLVVTLLAVASLMPSQAAALGQTVRWFHSPSGNIECEVAAADARGSYAYCQTWRPVQWARLGPAGHTRVCVGRGCSIGNGLLNATTLAYGRALRVGMFRCSSTRLGIRCVIVESGHGFTIARAGIRLF